MNLHSESFEAAGAKIGTTMMYSGAGASVASGLTLNQWGVIVGIIVGVVGLIANVWFKWREDQRSDQYWRDKRASSEGPK